MTKLRPHEVQEIRMWLRVGYPMAKVAVAYRVSAGAVNGIARGRTWTHLPVVPVADDRRRSGRAS